MIITGFLFNNISSSRKLLRNKYDIPIGNIML